MRCPVDNETLVMADRGGVEIDYCPKCRGVWLDRGELDKIIERAMGAAPAAAPAPSRPRYICNNPAQPNVRIAALMIAAASGAMMTTIATAINAKSARAFWASCLISDIVR